jgi:hypothetical protein
MSIVCSDVGSCVALNVDSNAIIGVESKNWLAKKELSACAHGPMSACKVNVSAIVKVYPIKNRCKKKTSSIFCVYPYDFI